MKCETCNINEATIHLTQVVNGVVKTVHICQECAEKNGVNLQNPISVTDILMGINGLTNDIEPMDISFDQSCPACKMRRSDLKNKHGRLGCPKCYESFMGEMTAVISAMHHSTQHIGKIPARAGVEERQKAKIATLRQKLNQMVAQENYEEAARIRDQIRSIKSEEDA